MSSLLFLSSDDFHIQQGEKGSILCTDIQGISMILFYSTECVYCKNLIPIFKNLPNVINGCQIGMINVSTNKRIVQMSHSTICPIKYVPFILLYVHGKPYMIYNGTKDIHELKKFILDVSNSIQSQSSFIHNNSNVITKTTKSIPEFTIGVPLCGKDGVCYLEYTDAYTKTN